MVDVRVGERVGTRLRKLLGKRKKSSQTDWKPRTGTRKVQRKRKRKMKRIPSRYQRLLHTLVLLFPLLFDPTPWSSSLLLWVPGCMGDVCYCPLPM